LLLRQDNADLRLRQYGYELGMITQEQYDRLLVKKKALEEETVRLEKIYKQVNGKGYTLAQLLCRPENTYTLLLKEYPESLVDYGPEINAQIELNIKYAGYIGRQEGEIAKLAHIENIFIPKGFDFNSVTGLRNEAKQKLSRHNPENLGQA